MHIRLCAVLLFSFLSIAPAQTIAHDTSQDSDHDGLSDALEDAILAQFAPQFMISISDCSDMPAEFVPFQAKPVVDKQNGTIYGQVFPRAGHADQVEVHYYHLWKTDCGERGHSLDTEHVSALLARDQAWHWNALYWYAAAHEDTVCDASQIARATAVDAQSHGPQVWISRGKHASFLSDALCARGCGGDRCPEMAPLRTAKIINLGELSAPMGGSVWIDSPAWPLAIKMNRSDFVQVRMTRVDQLPVDSVAWANPENRPLQAAIHGGNTALDGAAIGHRDTNAALALANADTGNALAHASSDTSSSLSKTVRRAKKALRNTAQKVGSVIGIR